ncbi:expressed unknown protein [Seminavis robusta]|uniref:Uncharacterized protein n=1 Tax=Seminavis robusta TaxID=568900 RepID=A0A9N8DXI1_9STRA|nr:expressed unknown protein [Seminavis robusta]|eukprot:Sro451_g145660.1 n/a (529) ;mRNA; r:15479-17149
MNQKLYIILIRLLAVAGFATSIFACFFPSHSITVNERPWVENLFDISCDALTGENRDHCETSYNTRHYTLWHSSGNFFSIQDWDGGVLCGSRDEFELPSETNPDITVLTVENLGKCSNTDAAVAMAFTILTCCFAAFVAIYITVLAHHHDAMLQVLLAVATVCSVNAIAIYCLEINPLRLKSTFCDSQTLFEHCEEKIGEGFWCQVATASISFLALALTVLRQCVGVSSSERDGAHHGVPFYKSLHFYVQLVRFSELAVLMIGVVSTWTIVRTTLPDTTNTTTSNDNLLSHAFAGKGGKMETDINLWQGLFCHPFGARLFLWSVVLNNAEEGNGGEDSELETFGHCDSKAIFHVQLGMIMATVSAITAMTFQKDAKSMPLAYLVGFIMHFMSMVKLIWSITEFMLDVYPGRSRIDPSYCSRWTSFVPTGGTCDIDIGPGLWLAGGALAAVAISFLGEVTLQRNTDYSVVTACKTLLGRVRQGRFTDLVKEASEHSLHMDDTFNEITQNGQESTLNDNEVATSGEKIDC